PSACRCSSGWRYASTRRAAAPPRTESETRCRCPAPVHRPWQTSQLTASREQTSQLLLSSDSPHKRSRRERESHRSLRDLPTHARDTSQAVAQSHPPRDTCRGRNSSRETPVRRTSYLKDSIRRKPEI